VHVHVHCACQACFCSSPVSKKSVAIIKVIPEVNFITTIGYVTVTSQQPPPPPDPVFTLARQEWIHQLIQANQSLPPPPPTYSTNESTASQAVMMTVTTTTTAFTSIPGDLDCQSNCAHLDLPTHHWQCPYSPFP